MTPSLEREEFVQITEQMLSPTVQLDRNCSGVVISNDPTIILTAKHCVDHTDQRISVIVPFYQNNRVVREDTYVATVEMMYSRHDLAYLRLMDTTASLPVARVAPPETILYEGEPTFVVGYPAGFPRTFTQGVFGGLEFVPFPNERSGSEYYRSTPLIIGGNSGGPLFHYSVDGQYELIGITSLLYSEATFMNYFVPLEDVIAFMEIIARRETE